MSGYVQRQIGYVQRQIIFIMYLIDSVPDLTLQDDTIVSLLKDEVK